MSPLEEQKKLLLPFLQASALQSAHIARPKQADQRPALPCTTLLQRADEVQKAEPKIAYYCRLYAVEQVGGRSASVMPPKHPE
jgi:hypothetical protein